MSLVLLALNVLKTDPDTGLDWLFKSIESNYSELNKRILQQTAEQKEEERKEKEEKIKRVEALRRERELQKQRQEEEERLKVIYPFLSLSNLLGRTNTRRHTSKRNRSIRSQTHSRRASSKTFQS